MADDNLTPKTGPFRQSSAPLIASLEVALRGQRTPREERYLQQLAQRVAETQATEAIPVLLRYTLASSHVEALAFLLNNTATPLTTLPTPLLLEMLAVVVRVDTPLAVTVAEALVTKAEKERTQVFAEALPLLPKTALHFLRLRKRLQNALKGNQFPIPAQASPLETDLPLPASEVES